MKSLLYAVAFATLMTVSCQKDEIQDDVMPVSQKFYRTLTVGMADTKVGFDENNSFY